MFEQSLKEKRKLEQRVSRELLLRGAQDFRDHKKGLSEWIKNSDDSYIRHEHLFNRNFSNIPIILNFEKDAISCLDFGGVDGRILKEHLFLYGSSKAAKQGLNLYRSVSGGHGNGGKYYALSQFKECHFFSYFDGKFTHLLVDEEGDYSCLVNAELGPNQALDRIGVNKWSFFEENYSLFEEIINRHLGFFFVIGLKPKDKKSLFPKRRLINLYFSIANQHQARVTLKERRLTILINGDLDHPDLKPKKPEIDEEFGKRQFALPDRLEEFVFNKKKQNFLEIQIAKEPLTGEASSFNTLDVDADGRNKAYYNIPSLIIEKSLSKLVMAKIDCPEIEEYNCISNDRVHLVDAHPLTSVLLKWCKEKIQEVISEIKENDKKETEMKQMVELRDGLTKLLEEFSDLLEEEDLITMKWNKKSLKIDSVDIPSDKIPGYGTDKKIKNSGNGERKGGLEKSMEKASPKRSKNKLKILLSNFDEDPLNPGNEYDMIERQPILDQRIQDVDYGIWWLNTQKTYTKHVNFDSYVGKLFYLFLMKDMIFSERFRKRWETDPAEANPDHIQETNFDLIDVILKRAEQKFGFTIVEQDTAAKRVRDFVRNKNEFTLKEISNSLDIDIMQANTYVNNPNSGILDTFKIIKKKTNGRGPRINVYIRKF